MESGSTGAPDLHQRTTKANRDARNSQVATRPRVKRENWPWRHYKSKTVVLTNCREGFCLITEGIS